MTSRSLALAVSEALLERKADEIRVLDLSEVSAFTDFFVIATGTSPRHLKTLADTALEAARSLASRPLGIEGETGSRWILIDLGDVVVHLFLEESRAFYDLERLWGDGEAVEPSRLAGRVS